MPLIPPPLDHLASRIYDAYAKRSGSWDNLGVPMASAVNPCERATWYSFRWVSCSNPITGQRQSTFDTDKYWEERLLNDLEAMGCEVTRFNNPCHLADGHLRGKMDAKAIGIPEAPKAVHIVECKSHNLDSYKDLLKKGLTVSKPDNYAQLQLYMHADGTDRGLYLSVCKDDDARNAERVKYDPVFCMRVEARVRFIVYTPTPPMKLHEDPNHKMAFQCGWCQHRGVCHDGGMARVNCRTCLHSTPLPGAKWQCERYGKEISYRDQQAGCHHHRYIPGLVAGEQCDVVGDNVIYQMKDGSIWADGDKEI